MSKAQTRSALIEAGRAMMFETGFNHTGIQSVLAAAKIPKGSFYYYFESKEDFGLAIIEDFVATQRAIRTRFLEDKSFSPLTRLHRYFEDYTNRLEQRNFSGGCLLGNLGQELSDQNDLFRERLAEAFTVWQAGIADCLREAKAAGEIAPSADENALADFCLSGWQGAMMRMKVAKSRVPLDSFVHMFFDCVLKP